MHQFIHTTSAPDPIGACSQALIVGDSVYLSVQIALTTSGEFVSGGAEAKLMQVFSNMSAIAQAAGSELSDMVKLTLYLTDLSDAKIVNQMMIQYFKAPYPARTMLQVSALPKAALIEIDAIMHLEKSRV